MSQLNEFDEERNEFDPGRKKFDAEFAKAKKEGFPPQITDKIYIDQLAMFVRGMETIGVLYDAQPAQQLEGYNFQGYDFLELARSVKVLSTQRYVKSPRKHSIEQAKTKWPADFVNHFAMALKTDTRRAAMYYNLKGYDDYKELTDAINCFLFLRHRAVILAIISDLERRPYEIWSRGSVLTIVDLEKLGALKQGKMVKHFGENLSLTSALRFAREADKWVRSTDGRVLIGENQFLNDCMPHYWQNYLLGKDEHGLLRQRTLAKEARDL